MKNNYQTSQSGALQTVSLEGLNEPQYDAVTTTEGPVLVIAGAGSGKTRTLVYRVAHLISKGVVPDSILLLTFTRKASQEMLWRAGNLLNDSCTRVTGGTFHGVANLLLRKYGGNIGFGSNFTIIDRADAEGIVNLLKSSLGFGVKNRQFPTKRVIVNMISGSINKNLALDDLVVEQYSHLGEYVDEILTLQKSYDEFKFNHGLMDYDDLLVNWKKILEEFPDIREEISSKFKYVMVDEYQDTNLIQADIVRLLSHSHKNVMVVGDDSQSIYSFRGADFYNIMRFPKQYLDTKVIKLEENYRSTQPILTLTNDIIRNATEKYTKTLFTSIEGDDKPKLYAGRDEREEARFISRTIRKYSEEGVELKEIAVLFRSGFHSYKLELELASEGFDFEKRGGLKLTESAHMKDVLAFLRLLANPIDHLSWNRILLQLDKVGPKTAQKISRTIVGAEDPFVALANYPAGKTWAQGLSELVRLFDTVRDKELSPGQLYEIVLDYYQPYFEQIYRDDFPKRQKDLDQLKGIVSEYDELQKFIDDTALDPPDNNKNATDTGAEKLILSTIHSSKGLEWDLVFILGLADSRFPHASATFGEQWEEERRLLYVAATRARKHLYMTYPRELMTPDRQFKKVGMSPFISELQAGTFERIESDLPSGGFTRRPATLGIPTLKKKKREKKLSINDFSKGTRVEHPFFGDGVVQSVKKPSTVGIMFDRHGVKNLHLDYAKLVILG